MSRCGAAPDALPTRLGRAGTVERELVRDGADPDAVAGAQRMTALIIAARASHWSVARLLIERGTDVNLADSSRLR